MGKPTCTTCGTDPRRYTRGCPECAERKAQEAEWETRFAAVEKARAAIVAVAGGRRCVSGRIPCPVCLEGELAFAVSKNGHIQAACETGRCVNWCE